MADRHSYPGSNGDTNGDTGSDTGVEPGGGSTTETPRWVKVFGIIALVLVLLLAILHLTGRGFRGHTPPSSVIEHGVTRP